MKGGRLVGPRSSVALWLTRGLPVRCVRPFCLAVMIDCARMLHNWSASSTSSARRCWGSILARSTRRSQTCVSRSSLSAMLSLWMKVFSALGGAAFGVVRSRCRARAHQLPRHVPPQKRRRQRITHLSYPHGKVEQPILQLARLHLTSGTSHKKKKDASNIPHLSPHNLPNQTRLFHLAPSLPYCTQPPQPTALQFALSNPQFSTSNSHPPPRTSSPLHRPAFPADRSSICILQSPIRNFQLG